MGELWKQCGAWLVRLGVLPPNHRYWAGLYMAVVRVVHCIEIYRFCAVIESTGTVMY